MPDAPQIQRNRWRLPVTREAPVRGRQDAPIVRPEATPRAPDFEAIPEARPDLGTMNRPTFGQVVEETVRPSFLKNEVVAPGDLEGMLKKSAALLEGGDGAMRLAAKTVNEALADQEIIEACRLFLIKG